jgi:putative ABC transport system permease protein
MLIVLYGKDEVSFDRFHQNKENIYHLTADFVGLQGGVSKQSSTGMMPGPAFKKNIPEVESFVRIQAAVFNIKSKGEVFEQEALWADDNLFSVFTFPFVYGNPSTTLNDLHSVVLSERLAEKYFGNANAVGKTLEMKAGDTFENFVVTGVVKNSPQNSSLQVEMILPMKYHQIEDDDKNWMNFFLNTFLVLKPGADPKKVEEKMAAVYAIEAAPDIKEMVEKYDSKEQTRYHLQPLLAMHLSEDYPANNGLSHASESIYSYMLFGIAGFILVIACINFINLTVARSLKRAKEIGVRKVIGGERKQLIFQFLGESFVLSFLAFVVACLLAYLLLPFFNKLANKELAFSYLLDLKLIAGYIVLFIITGLLAGFYPALVLSGFKPAETLYGKLRFSGKNYLSKSLVVFQFTLSTFLIIATITIYSQFNYLTGFDLGYDDNDVVVMNTGSIDYQSMNTFKTELYKEPAIKQITADLGGTRYTMAHINGEHNIDFNIVTTDEDYLPLFRIPVIKGRNFSTEFASDSVNAVIINESFAKTAGWREPIGKEVDFFYNNKKYTVIGMIKDYHFASLKNKIDPQLFMYAPAYHYGRTHLKITQGHKAAALSHLEHTFKKLYPARPFSYVFKDDDNRESYEKEEKWKQIIAFSALLTIFISCMGLFGLAALSAEKRAKEIGIRKVLGASVASIVQKLSGEFIRLVLIASCISLPLSWWAMNKWLENYPYRITLHATIFGVAIIIAIAVALVTVSYQSLKAAMANPVKNLRSE